MSPLFIIIFFNFILLLCIFGDFHRSSSRRWSGLRMGPGRFWWERTQWRKDSASSCCRYWADLWTRRSSCPTGTSGRCGQAKSATQVRREEHGGWEFGGKMGEETRCLYFLTFTDLPSSHRRLLPAGHLCDAVGQPGVIWAAG